MNLGKMLKQAQEMQSKMAEMQEAMANMSVTGTAGAGLVSVTLNGKGVLQAVKIDPSLYKDEEADVLEDLIVAAHADAKTKIDAQMQEKMTEMTGGLSLPPGMKLPF